MAKSAVTTKTNNAYYRLKEGLKNGIFSTGERLTEAKVCRILQLKRGPVRESLLRLEAEGLLKSRGAYRGKYVEFIEDNKPEDVLFRYEMREVIEGLAARLAAVNMTGWQIQELHRHERRLDDLRKTSDQAARRQASFEFHRYLLAHCGNPLLLATWESNQLMPMDTRTPELGGRIHANLAETAKEEPTVITVIEAIAAHDPDRAEQQMRQFVRRITESIRRALGK